MKKNLTTIISVISIILMICLGMFLWIQSGAFDKAPTVDVKADNCYGETLHVITDADYSPYSFFAENGDYSGHDVELIIMIANEMKMNLDLKLLPWDEGIAETTEGNADVLMTCDYSDTFAGVEKLVKTEPTSTDDFIVYARNKIETAGELYDKKIAVMKNGNVNSQIKMLNLKKNCVEYTDNREAMKALINGEVDCAIMRNTVGIVLLNELEANDIEGYISIGKSYMCFGVYAEDTVIIERLNNAIEKLKLNGEMDRLEDKWLTTFVAPYSMKEVVSRNIGLVLGFFAMIVAVLVYSVSRRIKNEAERNQYIRIIENLANDFECVNYVEVTPDYQGDRAELIRISDELKRNIPEWETETDFTKRLEFMMASIVIPEDRDRFCQMTRRDVVVEALKSDSSYFVNFRAIIDKEEQYYQLKFSATYDDEGNTTGYVCGVHNIDEDTRKEMAANETLQKALDNEKATERKLAEDKALLDYFMDAYSGAYSINLKDDTYEVLRVTQQSENFAMGGNISDLLTFIRNYVHPEDQEMMLQMIDKEYVRNRLKKDKNFSFTVREVFNGMERSMRCTIVEGIDEDHIAMGFMDITEQLEKEKEIQRELAIANESKTTFLFNMSHDIRTPMNAITGFTELASKHIDEKDKVQDYLEKIKNSSSHLLELINEVLDMSRVEAGRLTSDIKTVNIVDEASRMVEIYNESASSKDIRLTLITDDIVHENVLADELHVNRIISNILGNSVKYTLPKGNIVFSIRELESEIKGYGKYEFVIEDNGIGMSKEFLDKIYDSFAREENETVNGIQGTGLGMSIVKRLVDYLDGTIDVQSEKGKGTKTTIILHFMLTDSSIREERLNTNADLSNRKALLVEDNELNREIATEILVEQGITADEAANGKEAVSAIKKKGADYYDFVLMDIQMPFMNGYEATKAIRKLPKAEDLIIIALSANAFEEDRRKSMDAGMNDHVAKPINIQQLTSTLARYLK